MLRSWKVSSASRGNKMLTSHFNSPDARAEGHHKNPKTLIEIR